MTGSSPARGAQRSHYAVLGVAPSAGADEIRRAHRQLARVLHPDRLIDAPAAERRLAERRMREVNAAWTVLSDPARRAAYDRTMRVADPARSNAAEREPERAAAGAADADREDDAERAGADSLDAVDTEEPLPGWYFWLLRRGPVVAALLIAIGIFVFTAYAGTAGEDSPTSTALEGTACARIVDPVDRRAVIASCAGPNDGTIVTTVDIARKCPAGTRYVLMGSAYVCVDGR